MRTYNVYVTGKAGIFDPAGETSKTALENLGYEGVERVRIGKFIEVTTSDEIDADQVKQMCERLLANPVIEDFTVCEK